jgi:ribosome recycling factor
MVEDLPVDYFGTKSPLKQVASISLADPKTLVISPWNRDNLVDIEKAINDSDLNITVNNDGNVIRLVLPSLTEERRKELVKLLGKKTEEARIRVRKERETIWDEIQEREKNGELSEDDKFRMKDQLQILVDEYNQKIQSMSEKKEKEIMEI